jgi:hypothetical protein
MLTYALLYACDMQQRVHHLQNLQHLHNTCTKVLALLAYNTFQSTCFTRTEDNASAFFLSFFLFEHT